MTAPNPITGEDEPYFPERSRARRMLAGSVVIVVMNPLSLQRPPRAWALGRG
ncbi:Anoctamin-7 [Saguinus oedipus]|uniref:Anoctamin-7 n=1 Tax=Saguinus oedipus TaxID=9490 RepID=A0ABQ9VI77_SAGOE|nr:Anoctamin-7 [Saguinus oedipus]